MHTLLATLIDDYVRRGEARSRSPLVRPPECATMRDMDTTSETLLACVFVNWKVCVRETVHGYGGYLLGDADESSFDLHPRGGMKNVHTHDIIMA
jgi:hypothetical protein